MSTDQVPYTKIDARYGSELNSLSLWETFILVGKRQRGKSIRDDMFYEEKELQWKQSLGGHSIYGDQGRPVL